MPHFTRRVGLSLLYILAAAHTAPADVNLKIDLGWDNVYRAGHWTPIFITAWDPTESRGRNVHLEISSPHDAGHLLNVAAEFAITSTPRSIILYCPLSYQLEECSAVVRDLRSRRKLFEQSLDPAGSATGPRRAIVSYGAGGDDIVLGVSGPSTALGILAGQFKWKDDAGDQPYRNHMLRIGYLPVRSLPDAIVGYDGLDALVLNAPDLGTMPPAKQEIIAQWVRSGGRLLIWPGDAPVPPTSPLASILPAAVGDNQSIQIPLDLTRKFGLALRVAQLSTRRLDPAPSARQLPLLDSQAQAITSRAGLGIVSLLSINASQLIFDDEAAAHRFWRPILHDLLQAPDESPLDADVPYNLYSSSEVRQSAAMEVVIDRLGDVPGVGKFDFGYIALVLIALMFVVGPIDWFVLKKIGRQPWTWLTISGWIALLTLAALYLGNLVRSGDVHYRTVRLIDQADDRIVAATDIVGIYSPKTTEYALGVAPDQWWEPAATTPHGYFRAQHAPTQIDTIQDARGNFPLPLTINIWSLRFLRSELGDVSNFSPLISADLHRDGARVRGTITNRSNVPIHNVRIQTSGGGGSIALDADASIPPGQTIQVDAQISTAAQPKPQADNRIYYGPRMGGPNPYRKEFLSDDGFIRATAMLAPARSRRIEEILRHQQDIVCIYGESELPAAHIKLNHSANLPSKEKHWQIIRALVPLK